MRVLLVDDQDLVAESVCLLLEPELRRGWSFKHVENPLEAMDAIRSFRPNVVLVDVVMPQMNGIELLELIRSDPDQAALPVVIFSAEEEPRTKAHAFEKGASDYLVKLPDEIELVARLRHHAAGFAAIQERDEMLRRIERTAVDLHQRNDNLEDLNRMFRMANDELKRNDDMRRTQLASIRTVGTELAEIQDLDILMQHILTEARRLVGAESGAILTRDEDNEHELIVRYAQNDHHTDSGRSPADLMGGFRVPIDTGSISGTVVLTGKKLNIIDVYDIDPDAEYRFLASFDERTGYKTRSLFSYPLSAVNGDVLGVIQLANPFTEDGERKGRFDSNDEKLIENFASLASVALERAQLTSNLTMRMIAMAEVHDPQETGAHVNRVSGYSRVLFDAWARKRDMPQAELDRRRDRLSMAAKLHDVGKIGISDSILKKPGKLDDAEFATMQMHTVIGSGLFNGMQTDYDDVARIVALHHHEQWDGHGYPGDVSPEDLAADPPSAPIRRGLAGEEIPIEARIVGLADVYDALCSKRSYKEAWPDERVVAEIRSLSGTHFDPELVDLFVEHIDQIRLVRDTYSRESTAHT